MASPTRVTSEKKRQPTISSPRLYFLSVKEQRAEQLLERVGRSSEVDFGLALVVCEVVLSVHHEVFRSMPVSIRRMMMRSPQTLSEAERRLVAAWAADCAERVLWLFEAEAPHNDRPRALIARARAFARGELNTAEEIRRRFVGGVSAGEVTGPAAVAAARAAAQAVAVCHMGAHALGAAAYAAKAAELAAPDRPEAVEDEIRWQLDHMSDEVRAALLTLPPVGEDLAGPLGPGLLSSGQLRAIVSDLQAGLIQVDSV